jgi:ubiquinone/menaquinone biosynthesis C-methylase UbiE
MWFLEKLRCPVTGQALRMKEKSLVSEDGRNVYGIADSGIILFADKVFSENGKVQERHYGSISGDYLENLSSRHTRAYLHHLNNSMLSLVNLKELGDVAEICCGNGSAIEFLRPLFRHAVGVDISRAMLEDARTRFPDDNICFVQADATMLPLKDCGFDSVFVIGGIHHVNERDRLFSEFFRILRPGGTLYWREPIDENVAWKYLRKIVYRFSPNLEVRTERPLSRRETSAQLRKAGFSGEAWRECGLFAFMLFMNSDILPFFNLFKYVPGIEKLINIAARIDEFILKFRIFKNFGFMAVGKALR